MDPNVLKAHLWNESAQSNHFHFSLLPSEFAGGASPLPSTQAFPTHHQVIVAHAFHAGFDIIGLDQVDQMRSRPFVEIAKSILYFM